MAGTREGAKLTSATNRAKYGSDYYQRIGKMGGSAKVKKGFALMDKERVRQIGAKGGKNRAKKHKTSTASV